MNWFAFAVVAWLGIGLEVGFRDALRLGETSVAPSFLVPLAVYVTLSTPPRTASWAALLLGLLLDLTSFVRTEGDAAFVLAGPHALGMLLAGQLVLAARGIVIRSHFISIGVLSALAAMVMHTVVIAALTLRAMLPGFPELAVSPTDQLQARFMSAVYTGVLGLVMGLVLSRLDTLMGFHLDRHGRQLR